MTVDTGNITIIEHRDSSKTVEVRYRHNPPDIDYGTWYTPYVPLQVTYINEDGYPPILPATDTAVETEAKYHRESSRTDQNNEYFDKLSLTSPEKAGNLNW